MTAQLKSRSRRRAAILLVVSLSVCAALRATENNSMPLFVVHEGQKCGFINAAGAVKIPTSFDGCRDFAEGLASVEIDGKWGFIDHSGQLKIQPQFDESRWSFSEGLAAVRLGKNWGYIDVKGDFLIPPRFEYAQGFQQKRGIVLVDGQKHGIIDRSGVLLAPPFDDSGWEFSEGLLPVESEGKWGFVDFNGDVVIPFRFHQANGFAQGLASVDFSDDKNQWGFIDRTGKTVIPPQFLEAGYFGEDLAPVSVDFKYGYINTSGELTIPPTFEMAYTFTEGLAGVIDKHHKYGFIDQLGRFVISPKYDLSFGFTNGLAPVSYGRFPAEGLAFDSPELARVPMYEGAWGYIDRTGKEVWATAEFRSAANKHEVH